MRMTRFARANNATKKQPEDATSWEEMVKDFKNEGRNSEELETYTPQRKRKPPDARGKTEPRRGPVVKLAKLNISLDVNESGTKRTMQSPMKKTPPYKTRSRVKAAALRIADSTGNRNERELIGVGIDVVSKGEASQEALTPIQKTPRTRRRKRRTTSLDNGSGQVDKNDELENAKQNMVISSQKSKVKKSSGTPKKKTITVNPVVDAVKNSVVKSPDSTELRYQTPLKSQGSGEVGFAIGPVNDTKSELKTVDKILPEEYGSEKTSLKSPNSNISNKLMDTICARHSDDRDSKDIPEKESVDTVIVSKGGEVSVAISPCNNRKEANLNLSDKALSKGERNEEMVLKSPSSSTNQKLMDIASEWLPNNDNKDTLEDGDAAARLRQFDEGKLYTITKQDESELKTGSDRATPERRKLQGTVSKSFQASMSPKGLHHGIADVTSGNDVDDYVKKDCDDLNGSSQKDNIGKEMLSPNQRKYSEGKNMPNLRSGPIFSMDKLNLSVQFSDGNLKDSVGKTSPEGCDSGMTEVSVKLDANGDSTEVSQKNSAMCVTSAPKGSSNVKLAEVGVNPDVIANSTKKTVLKSPVNNNVNNQIKNEIVSHDVGDDDEMEDSDNYFELGSEDEEDDEFGEDSDENDDDDCDLDDEEEEDADTCDKVDKSTCKRPQTKNKVDKGESKFVPKVEPDSKVAKMNVGAGAIDKMSKKELNSCKTLISPPKKTVFKTSPKETVNTKESQAVSHDSDDDGEEENDSQQKSKLDKGGNKSSHKGECHPKLDKVNLIIGATDRNSKKTLAPFEKNLPSRKKTSFKTDLVEVVNNKKLQVFSHDLEDGDEKSEVDKCKNKLAPKGELDTKLAIKKLSTDAIKRITSKVLSSSQKATPSPEKIIFKTAPERAVNDKRNKIFYHDSDDEEEEEEDDDDDDEDDGEKEDDDDEDGGDDDDEDDGEEEEEEEEEDDNDDGEEEDDDEDEEEKEEEEDIFQKVKVEKGKNKPVSKGDPFSKLAQVKLNTGAKKTAFRAAPKEALNKRSREVIYQNSVDEEEDDDDEDDDDSADSRQKVKVNMTKTKPAPKDGSNSKLAKKKLSADAFERITKKGLSSTQKSTPSLEKITFKTAPEEVVNDKRNKMFYHDSDDEEEQDGDDDTEEEDDNEDDGEEEDDNDEDDGEEEDDNDEDDGEEEDNDDDDDDDGGDDDDDENDEDDDSDDDSADSPQKIKVNLTKTKPAPKSEFNSKLAKVQQNAVAIIGIKNKFSVYRTTTSNKQNKIMSYDDDDDTGITEWISKKLLSSPQEAITPFMQIEFKTAQKEDVNNERSKVTLFSQDSDDDDDDDDVDDDDDDVEDDDDDDDVEDDDDEEKDDNDEEKDDNDEDDDDEEDNDDDDDDVEDDDDDEEKDDNDEDDEEDNDDDDSDKDNDASPQKIKVNIDKNKPQPKGEHNSKIAKVRLITGAVEEISKKELSSSQIPIPPSKKTAFKTASKGAVNDKKNKAFSHDSNDDDEEEEDGNYQIKSNGNKTCQQKRKFPAIGGPKAKVLKAQSNTDAKVSIKSDMAEQNVQTVNKTQGVIIKRFASTSIADKDHESKPSLVNIGKGMPKGGSAPSFSTIGRKAEIESASCLPIKVANHSSSNVNNAKETRFGAKCFCCRETGHKMWQCPRKEKSNTVCYKCGSAEHLSRQCKTKRSGSMPYAVCFLCNKMGHIVRNCPENTKGVYPDGGSCSICNSISHKKSECPKKRKGEKEISAVLAKRGAKGESADFQEEFTSVNAMTKQNKSKIVKF